MGGFPIKPQLLREVHKKVQVYLPIAAKRCCSVPREI